MPAYNIAVYISGGGSNFRAINENCKSGKLKSAVKLLISSNEAAGGINYAKAENIPVFVLKRTDFRDKNSFADAQLKILSEMNINLIVLAGYMKKLSLPVIKKYAGKIINIHPALLPAFGGKGLYGNFVHEAVIAARADKSGATVHFVDEIYDHGKHILQQEIPVKSEDTPETLQAKVLKIEHQIYSEAIKKLEIEGLDE